MTLPLHPKASSLPSLPLGPPSLPSSPPPPSPSSDSGHNFTTAELPLHPANDTLCILCNSPARVPCPGCTDARYCSRECLGADVDVHGLVCETLAQYQTCPIGDHVRGVYFAPGGRGPVWVWLMVKKTTIDSTDNNNDSNGDNDSNDNEGNNDDEGKGEGGKGEEEGEPEEEQERVLVRGYCHTPLIGRHVLHTNPLRNKLLPHTLHIYHEVDSTFPSPNTSLEACVIAPRVLHWRGALLAVALDPSGAHVDATPADVRHAVDFLTWHEWRSTYPLAPQIMMQKHMAVRALPCATGAREPQRFVHVAVPEEHPVYRAPQSTRSPVAQLLGVPLIVTREPLPRAAVFHDPSIFENPGAGALMRDLDLDDSESTSHDPSSTDSDLSPPWTTFTGIALLLHSNFRSLTPLDAAALCAYARLCATMTPDTALRLNARTPRAFFDFRTQYTAPPGIRQLDRRFLREPGAYTRNRGVWVWWDARAGERVAERHDHPNAGAKGGAGAQGGGAENTTLASNTRVRSSTTPTTTAGRAPARDLQSSPKAWVVGSAEFRVGSPPESLASGAWWVPGRAPRSRAATGTGLRALGELFPDSSGE